MPPIRFVQCSQNVHKIPKANGGLFRQKGVRLVIYIDDVLIMVDAKGKAITHLILTLDILEYLGFLINLRKINSRFNSTDRIPGFSGQRHHHEYSTTSGEDPEGNQGSRVAVAMPGDHTTPVSENGGNSEFMYPSDNTSPTTLPQSADRQEQGGSARRVQSPDLPITAIQGGATMVVPVFDNPQWETIQDTPSRPHHLYRCISA